MAPWQSETRHSTHRRAVELLPEYRQYATLRRHPVLLGFIARHVLNGAVEGARQGYRTIRSELGELVPPHAVDAALRDLHEEGRRLAAAARVVEAVERALRAK